MTYETLLEELQLLSPIQLKQNVLVYDKTEQRFLPPSHKLCYAVGDTDLNKGHPYLTF